MITRDSRLIGVWAKIKRADQHISDYEMAKKVFINKDLYTFIQEEDPKTLYNFVVVDSIKPIPDDIVCIIGDTIHNLRSSLDLLACQLMKLSHPKHTCKDIGFPISDSASAFKSTLQSRKIQSFDASVVQMFTQLETYKGGARSSIWELHRLDIQDKHRLLLIAGAAIGGVTVKVVVNPDDPTKRRETTLESSLKPGEFRIFKQGHKFIRVDPKLLVPNQGDVAKMDFKFTGDIVFNEPGIVECKSVLDTLIGYSDIVKDTVNQFIPLFV